MQPVENVGSQDLGERTAAFGAGEYDELIELWILRILLDLGGHRKWLERHSELEDFDDDEVMAALSLEGLDKALETVEEAVETAAERGAFGSSRAKQRKKEQRVKRVILNKLKVRRRLLDTLSPGLPGAPGRLAIPEIEANPPRLQAGVLMENVSWLQETLGLSDTARDILALYALAHECSALYKALELPGYVDRARLPRAIATILAAPADEARAALGADGVLRTAGLVHIGTGRRRDLSDSIELIDGLEDVLLQEQEGHRRMLERYFSVGAAPQLSVEDYPHVSRDVDLVRGYLAEVAKTGARGVNVLLYGPPGTGKTQLVRVMAETLGLSLYEVAMQDEDGDPLSGEQRFRAYRLAQSLLARRQRCVILFDEIEDVFPGCAFSLFGGYKFGQDKGKKAWVNRLLEENPVPAFWLSNKVTQIDPANLRRFDYIMELPIPTRSVRHKMLKTYLGGLPVSETWLERAAQLERVAPANLERAAKVVATLPRADAADTEKVLERILGSAMRIMGAPGPARSRRQSTLDYRVDILNADMNLSSLLRGVGKSGFGRLCLYGPPGTGKTAFAAHLAAELDRPLVKKRASDLVSKWVGETEKNIAEMFRRGDQENAVLLLDEADSFLQERRRAERSWEVSQVNELLVQMEACDGIFIASTNLVDVLDQATFRRFDIKIRFNYLAPEQALTLLGTVLGQDIESGDEARSIRSRLAQLPNLAIGDFAALLGKQCVTSGAWGARDWIDELERECALKPDARSRPLGFIT